MASLYVRTETGTEKRFGPQEVFMHKGLWVRMKNGKLQEAYSFATALAGRSPTGRLIINITSYSRTSSAHLPRVLEYTGTETYTMVAGVPLGTASTELFKFNKTGKKKGRNTR